ncbi:MAG: hypothetical protein ACFE8V_08400 [Promethearchaeota archaeon]
MRTNLEHRTKYTLFFLLILITPAFLTTFLINSSNTEESDNTAVNENFGNDDELTEKFNPISSDTYLYGNPLDVQYWWNNLYGYRIGFKIEEVNGIDRYQPIDIYFPNFNDYEHYKQTTRLVRWNALGSNQYSGPIPIEVWNITDQITDTNYIKSCTITFMVNVTANSNSTYFLYYNNDMDGITPPVYSTGFVPVRLGDRVTISINPPSGSEAYDIEFEKGGAINKLQMGSYNFHRTETFRPEKHKDQLKFLLHLDEGFGTTAADSTGTTTVNGEFGIDEDGNPTLGDPDWNPNGIVGYCLYFDRSEEDVLTWYGEGTGGSAEEGLLFLTRSSQMENFTITAWIKPEVGSLQPSTTNHRTQNCFLSKASDDHNDNIEMGVITDGAGTNKHQLSVYLDTRYGAESTVDATGYFGDTNVYIKEGIWNFIAFKYEYGDSKVYLWNEDTGGGWFVNASDCYVGTSYMGANIDPWLTYDTDDPTIDAATGSVFTIGASQHGQSNVNQYFQGWIDEVAIYSTALYDDEIENYKTTVYDSEIESIETLIEGQVMARYRVNWTTTFDMHVSDIYTFYYDYNLWNIRRSVWFDALNYPDSSTITFINAFYNLTGDIYQNGDYYYDGVREGNWASHEAENYTVIYDLTTPWDSYGLFIADFSTPDPYSDCSTIKGDIDYILENSYHYLQYYYGTNNDFNNDDGGKDNVLYLDLWEYCDRPGSLTEVNLIRLYNNISYSLRSPLDRHIYTSDNKFYNLQIEVTDIDNNVVPNAMVSVYNSTTKSLLKTQYTNALGVTTFTRLIEDTYTVNVSYLETNFYDQTPLTITTPKDVALNDNTVINNLNITKFENVDLTSLNVTCRRWDSGSWQEYVSGAKIPFTIANGSDIIPVGWVSTDDNGKAVIRWHPLADAGAGNITFNIIWHGQLIGIINNTYSIDRRVDLDSILSNVTLPYYQEDLVYINVSTSSRVETFLEVSGAPTAMLGENLFFTANYTYSLNGAPPANVSDALITYEIYKYKPYQLVSTGPETLSFTQLYSGQSKVHELWIDTSLPIDSGGINWEGEVWYIMELVASAPSYPTQTYNIYFKLDGITSALTAEQSSVSAYWNENLNFRVLYENIFAEPDVGITGATVTFEVNGYSYINGSFLEDSDGWYNLSLGTNGIFPQTGSYSLEVQAMAHNYLPVSIDISISINKINTKLNGSELISQDKPANIFIGVRKIFTFIYQVAANDEDISNADTSESYWVKFNEQSQIEAIGYNLNIINTHGGVYEIDFNTENLEVGTYSITLIISKQNFAQRIYTIDLTVSKRIFFTTAQKIYDVVSGNNLVITLSITDLDNGNPIDDIVEGDAYVNFLNRNFTLYHMGGGVYRATLTNIPADAFFAPKVISAVIYINRVNYTTVAIDITVNVGMIEIFPGFPLFYFLMIIAAVVAVAGSLVAYRAIQRARIPTFVKRVREIKSAIKSKKSISESLLYPSKEEYLLKRVGDKWEMLGLSLDDILGVQKKKGKRIPQPSEYEGGAV